MFPLSKNVSMSHFHRGWGWVSLAEETMLKEGKILLKKEKNNVEDQKPKIFNLFRAGEKDLICILNFIRNL